MNEPDRDNNFVYVSSVERYDPSNSSSAIMIISDDESFSSGSECNGNLP